MEELLTVQEVANLLKVKVQTIYNWLYRHEDFKNTSKKLYGEVRFIPEKLKQWQENLAS